MKSQHIKPLRSLAEARAAIEETGQSIAAWAVEHGYDGRLVGDVLRGRLKGNRGQSHCIAVELGIKEGRIPPRPVRRQAAGSGAVA